MSFYAQCPYCQTQLECQDPWDGQECPCPQCGKTITLRRPAAPPPMAAVVSPGFGAPPPPPGAPMPNANNSGRFAENRFTIFWICGAVATALIFPSAILLSIGVLANSLPPIITGFIIVLLGLLPHLIFGVMLYILLYQYWELVPAGTVEPTPLLCIALMFIPGFNLYWFSASLPKLARALQERAGQWPASGAAGHCLAAGLVLEFCGGLLLGCIPYAGPILLGIGFLAGQLMILFSVVALHKSARQIALNHPELLS